MRTSRVAPTLALAALAAAVPATSAQAATHPTCKRAHTKTLTQNSTTRVYQRTSNGVTTLYGCLKARGKAVKLAKRDFDPELGTNFSKIRLAGRFVAWADQTTDNSCKAACPPGYDPTSERVAVRDLRRKSTRSHDAGEGATALVVTYRGAIAWTEGPSGDKTTLYALDSKKYRTLDQGEVAADTLKVSGSTLSWLDSGGRQSTVLAAY
jgi:hypothetical protein